MNTEKTLHSISNFSLSMRQHNFSTGNYQSIVSKSNHFQSGDVQRVLFSFSSLNVCLVPINNTYLALRSLYSSHSPRTLIHEKRYSFKKILSDIYSPQKKNPKDCMIIQCMQHTIKYTCSFQKGILCVTMLDPIACYNMLPLPLSSA